jgi:hypothetical protein|tara:strand:- start:92 stop:346 length:255 start_codon:yes stop_codon:yes gene_type:complete
MLVVQCKDCNKEIISHETQSRSCGCPNMTTVKGEVVTAVDLSRVVMLQSAQKQSKKQSLFSPQELQFQEERRKRKVRKLDFEVR